MKFRFIVYILISDHRTHTKDDIPVQDSHNHEAVLPVGLPLGREVPHDPRTSVEFIKSWIKECQIKHIDCKQDQDTTLPKRFLSVGSSESSITRLIEAVEVGRASYVALSHRWGGNKFLTTTRETIEERKRCIEWRSLSPVFQDAIYMTRALGLQHIWIDALCIIQDDSEDWEIESSKMASIYEGAQLTIAANTTTSLSDGLFPERNQPHGKFQVSVPPADTMEVLIRKGQEHDQFFAGSLESRMIGDDSEYPLERRAWCFQERSLATRVLHFTDSELIFECNTGCQCECGAIVYETGTPLKHLFCDIIRKTFKTRRVKSNPWQGWTDIVSAYMRKELTQPFDILPALSGIASRLQCQELGSYIAGLWEHHLDVGLFWYAEISSTEQQTSIPIKPSFSWTSLAGISIVTNIYFHPRNSYQAWSKRFEVLRTRCTVAGLNPYGSVSDASVQINGQLVLVGLNREDDRQYGNAKLSSRDFQSFCTVFLDRSNLQMTSGLPLYLFIGCTFSHGWEDAKKNPGYITGLLLSRLGKHSYERVGCIPQLRYAESWFEHAVEENFTLI